jgi:hypothetical protein
VVGMVPNVDSPASWDRLGLAWFGMVATGRGYRPGQDSDPAIPPIGAAESPVEGAVRGFEGIACEARSAPLTVNSQGFRIGRRRDGPPRAPALTPAARCPWGRPRGRSARRRPTWPEGSKIGRRRPAREIPSDGDLVADSPCAVLRSALSARGASHDRRPAQVRRAPRALEGVEKVLTGSGRLL